jgi:hypothetical protein
MVFWVTAFVLCVPLHGQETGQTASEGEQNSSAFFFALGENILSNTLLYLVDRHIAKEAWVQITPASIGENLSGPWVWARDEYFTNQFGHPYQGSIYHTVARSNGFNIYLAMAVVSQKEKKNEEEEIWQERALALYPTNRFKETLLRQAGK